MRPGELFLKGREWGMGYVLAACTAVKNSHWKHWDGEKKRSFIINVCVGIVIAVIFQILSHGHTMEKGLNTAMDGLIRKETTALLASSKRCMEGSEATRSDCAVVRSKFSQKVIFIDIDHDTYLRWGEPLLMPRDKLAHFLRLADKNGARAVLFDILFDYPSPKPVEDRRLRKVLEEMTRNRSPLHVVFPTLTSRIDGTLKKGVFDGLIDTNPNFHRGLPYVAFSRADRVVRYLRYYEVTKGPDGKSRVLWSTSLLSVVLFTGDAEKLASLEEKILRDREQKRDEAYTLSLSTGGTLDISNHELFSNRIRFSLIPPGVLDSQGNLFTERVLPDELEALQSELRDKIVVIGTSSADKEGWYVTPVGDMPGMYIIGNGINMMLGGWQVRDAPRWVGIILQGLVIIFAAFMLVNFKGRAMRIVSMLLIACLVSPATYYFYRVYGIFINSAQLFFNSLMPVLGMGWDKMFTKKKAASGEKQ
jgi:hypothetical protein